MNKIITEKNLYNMETIIKNCVQCGFHVILPDPDPDDWFCDDDKALLCTHPHCSVDDYTDKQKEYYRERGWDKIGRVIISGERPYNIIKEKVPSYCPLFEHVKFNSEKR